MSLRVLFFAQASDWMGCQSLEHDLAEPMTLAALLENPIFENLRGRLRCTRFAVNCEFAALTATVRDGDELAVIPPVSGG